MDSGTWCKLYVRWPWALSTYIKAVFFFFSDMRWHHACWICRSAISTSLCGILILSSPHLARNCP